MSKSTDSQLLAAARQLDEDIRRFQGLSAELSRTSVNSDKSLQRARQALEECSAHETRLAESLRAFGQAMQWVQATQQASMEAIAQAAELIARRNAERMALQERVGQLGAAARAVSAPVSNLTELDDASSGQALAPLGEVERRLDAVIAEAAEVCALAEQGDWTDLLRDTRSLREQLQAVRNRVLLMRRKLSHEAPS